MRAGQIDLRTCARLVESAGATCSVPHPATASVAEKLSTGDGLATIGVAIALATFGLAIVTLATAFGWAIYVKHLTKVAAFEEAKMVVPAQVENMVPGEVKTYLDERLPGMVSEALTQLQNPSAQPQTQTQQEGGLREDAG